MTPGWREGCGSGSKDEAGTYGRRLSTKDQKRDLRVCRCGNAFPIEPVHLPINPSPVEPSRPSLTPFEGSQLPFRPDGIRKQAPSQRSSNGFQPGSLVGQSGVLEKGNPPSFRDRDLR
eukprot:scaffold2859_cov349-Pavlova_lutheri.AAC.6